MKSTFLAVALAAMLGASIGAYAAQDEAQRLVIQHVMAAKAKLQLAQAAKGSERTRLMSEHMKMMKDVMDEMSGMKPHAGMTMQEHEAWLAEHQKLMQQMMDQMQAEHHMMMEHEGAKPAAADQHKH